MYLSIMDIYGIMLNRRILVYRDHPEHDINNNNNNI